jgi:hypothetical protein
MKNFFISFFLFFSISCMAGSILMEEPESSSKGGSEKQIEYKKKFGSLDEDAAKVALGAIAAVFGLSIAGIALFRKIKNKKSNDI